MSRDRSLDIAVTGMTGRFPGAADVTELWAAIVDGHVLLGRLTPEQLADVSDIDDPDYVPVRGYLSDADRFDNRFFGISPRDAELMDPQQRLMLECGWAALEDAGQVPGAGP